MTACVNFGKAGEAQAVENFWFALTGLEVKEEKQESGEPVKKKVDFQNLMLTSLKYKLGCGGEHAMLSQTHSTGCVLSTLAQRERGHIWSLLHPPPPPPSPPPPATKYMSDTYTHTDTTASYHHCESYHWFSYTSLFADKMHLGVAKLHFSVFLSFDTQTRARLSKQGANRLITTPTDFPGCH